MDDIFKRYKYEIFNGLFTWLWGLEMKCARTLKLLIVALLSISNSASSSEDYSSSLSYAKQGYYERAVRTWTKLSTQGDPAASYNLGEAHLKGLNGVVNLVSAINYFEYAAANGVPDAYFKLSESFELRLSTEDRIMAAAWLEAFQANFSEYELLTTLAENKRLTLLSKATYHEKLLGPQLLIEVTHTLKSLGNNNLYDGRPLFHQLFPHTPQSIELADVFTKDGTICTAITLVLLIMAACIIVFSRRINVFIQKYIKAIRQR